MALNCIYSNNEEKAYWDEGTRKVILPDKTEYTSLCAYPNAFGQVTCAVPFKGGSFLLTDTMYHRIVLLKKDIAKPFGPVLNAPYSIAYAGGYIYVATQPNGIIEPSVITVIDESENIYGQLYMDHHVSKNKSYMMYSKDYQNPLFEPEKPLLVKMAVKSLKAEGQNIVVLLNNGESISFNSRHPENAMLTSIGWRYINRISRTVRAKKSIFSYSLDNLSTLDYKNTSLQPSEEPAFQNNIGYSIENFDDKDIYIYGIKNGKMDFSNMPSLLECICKDCESDTEKVYALWNFVRTYMLKGVTWPQTSFKDDGKFSAIRFLNSMGSGACASFNGMLSLMAQVAGISAKTGSLSNGSHSALRLFLNMKDIYIDAFYGGCSPLLGSAIASGDQGICTYEELCEDPYLLRRASDESVYKLASMIGYKDSWVDGWADSYSDPNTMGFFLKPKEKMEFSYAFNGTFTGTNRPHANIVTGKKTIILDRNEHVKRFFEMDKMKVEKNVFSCVASARTWYSAQCPYPITGIMIEGRLYKGTLTISSDYSEEQVEISKKQEFCTYFGNNKSKAIMGPQNSIYIEFKAYKAQFRVSSITLFFQANRVTLCSLNAGVNNLEIEADKGKLKVTHEFINSTMPRPKAPVLKKKPQGIFEWTTTDASSYEFILSAQKECCIPFAPIFHQIIEKPEVNINCQAVLFPDRQYFWRVRAKNRYGIWGPWSHTETFIFKTPNKPTGLILSVKDRDVRLSWEANKHVKYYEVYGSNEKAFIPSKTDYTMAINRTDMTAKQIVCPKNYIQDVKTSYINLTQMDLKYCYRVIAVDKKGNASIASEYVCLPHPLIFKDSICSYAYTGSPYSSYAKCVSSIGMMRFNRTNENPMYTDYTEADHVIFHLEGPAWLKIRDYDGYLYGTPNNFDAGINIFNLKVESVNGNKDSIQFEIFVMEGV